MKHGKSFFGNGVGVIRFAGLHLSRRYPEPVLQRIVVHRKRFRNRTCREVSAWQMRLMRLFRSACRELAEVQGCPAKLVTVAATNIFREKKVSWKRLD